MAAQKTGAPPETGAKQQQAPAGASADAKRKSWVKKTPTEIILEQVKKQEEKVSQLKKELAKEEAELKKMQKAAEIFQAS